MKSCANKGVNSVRHPSSGTRAGTLLLTRASLSERYSSKTWTEFFRIECVFFRSDDLRSHDGNYCKISSRVLLVTAWRAVGSHRGVLEDLRSVRPCFTIHELRRTAWRAARSPEREESTGQAGLDAKGKVFEYDAGSLQSWAEPRDRRSPNETGVHHGRDSCESCIGLCVATAPGLTRLGTASLTDGNQRQDRAESGRN